MPGHHINELATTKQPKEAAFGQLSRETTPDRVTETLVAAAVDADRIHYLVGTEGASVLRGAKRGFLTLFDDVIDQPIAALDAGHTLVGVFGTSRDQLAAVKHALTRAGVDHLHYFGTWTYH